MTRHFLVSLTALGLLGSALCRADIVVDFGLATPCPPCVIGPAGQPDLATPRPPGPDQQFTLAFPVDVTSIIFWTYEVPGVSNLPVDWSITDALSHIVGSGTDPAPLRGAPVLVPNLAGKNIDLQVSMITLNLPTPVLINPNPGPDTLSLKFHGGQSLYFWGQGKNDHLAFQLAGTNATVPEPSFLWFTAAGMGLLAAFRIRRKR